MEQENINLWEIPDRVKELMFYIPHPPKPGARCLDFSPYRNHLGMKDHIEHVGYEYLVADLEPKEEGVIKEDICSLSFEDASFNLIICSHIMEHVTDTLAGLRQIYRVLVQDGICLFSTPCVFNGETQSIEPVKKRHFHVWRFGYRDIRKMVEKAGFRIGLEIVRPVKPEANYLAILHKGLSDGLFVGSLGMALKLKKKREKRSDK